MALSSEPIAGGSAFGYGQAPQVAFHHHFFLEQL